MSVILEMVRKFNVKKGKVSDWTDSCISPSLILVLILGFALLVRVLRAKAGLPYLYAWDEPQTASNALQMLKTGNFNPHFFAYGTLTIYVNYLVDVVHYFYLMGQPVDAKDTLNALWEIQTVWDTKWHWTISHPSFYYWNRIAECVFGAATVLLVYLVSKLALNNRWASLLSALTLAAMGAHIDASVTIAPDILVAFFVLATVFMSLLFVDTRNTRHIFWALLFSGCAIATKYNSLLVLILPTIALFYANVKHRPDFKQKWVWMLPVVPVVTFVICMPFALLDSAAFLHGIGSELRHYKVLGHAGASSEPGWPNMVYQFAYFRQNLGLVGSIIAWVGLLNVFRKPKMWLILLLPVLYFLYMTQMKVNFHRNFILVYPFIAVLFGSSVDLIYAGVRQIAKKSNARPLIINFGTVLMSALVLFVMSMAWEQLRISLAIKHHRDSRTLVIDRLDDLPNIDKVYFAAELRMHAQDVKRLGKPHETLNLSEIYACPSPVNDGVVLLPALIDAVFPTAEERTYLSIYEERLKQIPDDSVLLRGGQKDSATLLDIYSTDPEIIAVRGSQLIKCVGK